MLDLVVRGVPPATEAYAQALADDGYDDLQHITGLDEQEIDEVLEEIGMKKGHRRTFKREWAKLQ